MKVTQFFPLGIGLVLALTAAGLRAEPLLNGLAVSTEFGKERFIAALYADNLSTDANEILNGTGHRRMELKVTADSISARSINSMWIEGMAINNAGGALEAQAENLAKLNNMVRKRLRANDVLAFDAESGKGTTVSLNGITLGRIHSDDFFPMLLRTWIGSIPLSSEFKSELLAGGQPNRELADRYARIEPAEARVQAVAGWVAPEPPRPKAADDGIEPPKPQPPKPVVALSPPPKPKPEPAVAKTAKPAERPSETKAAEPARVAKAAPAPKPAPKPVVKDEEEEAEEVMVTAESLLVRQRYISDVMRQTLQNMRYPRRAQERNQEGSIRLAVTIARNGKLRDVKIVEESRYSLLNKEALASVERASPFPEVPEGIAGDTVVFGMPVTFRLQ